jgi:hypothetical protein
MLNFGVTMNVELSSAMPDGVFVIGISREIESMQVLKAFSTPAQQS